MSDKALDTARYQSSKAEARHDGPCNGSSNAYTASAGESRATWPSKNSTFGPLGSDQVRAQ